MCHQGVQQLGVRLRLTHNGIAMQSGCNEVFHCFDVVLLKFIPRSFYFILLMSRQPSLLSKLFDPSLDHMAQAWKLIYRRDQ